MKEKSLKQRRLELETELSNLKIKQKKEENRIRQEKKDLIKNSRPLPLKNPDFSEIVKACESYMKAYFETEYWDDDMNNYIWEIVVRTIYGKDFFTWFNETVR
jgi:hypothetical protein